MHPLVSVCFIVIALLAVAVSSVLGSSSILEGGLQQKPQNYPPLVAPTLPPAMAVSPKSTTEFYPPNYEGLIIAIEPPLGNNIVPSPHPGIPRKTPGIYPVKQVTQRRPETPPRYILNAPPPNLAVAREAPGVYTPKPDAWKVPNVPPQTSQMTAPPKPVIQNTRPQEYRPYGRPPELTNKRPPNSPLKPPFPFNKPPIYPPHISKESGLPPIHTITPPNPVVTREAPGIYPPKPETNWKEPTLRPQTNQMTAPPKSAVPNTRSLNYQPKAMPPEMTNKRPSNHPIKSPSPFSEPSIYPPRLSSSMTAGLPPVFTMAPRNPVPHKGGKFGKSIIPPTAQSKRVKVADPKHPETLPPIFWTPPPPYLHRKAVKKPEYPAPMSGKVTTSKSVEPLA